jgi:arylsulfatase A-like enzyme/Tfp pilus assembly protein PilF
MKIRKKHRRRLTLLVSIVVLVVAGMSLRPSGPAYDIRHVVLISIDTCRADHLGCYGATTASTPNIDALAAAGVLFENVISPIPQTLPAHSSMMTGAIPPAHGVHDNQGYKLGAGTTTLAEILKTAGYATGAVVSAFVLDKQFGLAQGFDTWHDSFEAPLAGDVVVQRQGGDTTAIAVDWIDKHHTEKFFYFLHYYDPHSLYRPPEPFATQFAADPYAGEIAYVDHCIGQVIAKLKDLGIYDETLLIVTADHGEMLGDHGEATHGYFIYQGSVSVPMIFKVPGATASHRVDGVAGIVDVVPTICGMLGLEPPPGQGIDLTANLDGAAHTGKDRYVFCESLWATKYEANSLLGVVDERYKYIQTTRPELYDLSADPAEARNVIAREPELARRMQEKLADMLESSARKSPNGGQTALDAESRKRLESLGYVGGAVDETFRFDQSKRDPKELLQFHELAEQIPPAFEAREYARVAVLAQQQIDLEPDLPQGYGVLAEVATNQGDYPTAIASYTTVIERLTTNTPSGKIDARRLASACHSRGVCRGRAGDPGQALIDLDRAIELNPALAEAYIDRGKLHRQHARNSLALADFSQAVTLAPQNPQAWYNRAMTRWGSGSGKGVVEDLTTAIKLAPQYVEARVARGTYYDGTGQIESAARDLQAALDLAPNHAAAHGQLGQLLIKQRQPAAALGHYREALSLKADWQAIINELAWRLATLEDDALRDGAEAVVLAEQACEMTRYKDPGTLDTLAAAYAESGRLDEAIETALRAVVLAEAAGDHSAATIIRQHVGLFRDGRAIREPL